MTDRSERSKKLAARFEDEPDEEESSKTSQTDKTDMSDTTTQSGESDESDKTSLKDKPSVLMYLDEDLKTELDARFDELNARHRREHGDGLEKNRDYYPAVIEAGLEGEDVEDVLDL